MMWNKIYQKLKIRYFLERMVAGNNFLKESFYAKWCLVDDYDPTTISKILENRRMDDVLFIDRVFSFSGQDLNEIYPSGKLSNLIEQIVKSPILDELKINCLVCPHPLFTSYAFDALGLLFAQRFIGWN